MARQMQEQEHNDLHRDERRHPLPLWVRWFIVLFVLFIVIACTILWIIQGAQAIIPVAVFTALGIIIAFSQVLPWLFPDIKHEHSPTSSSQSISGSSHMFSPSPFSQSPPSSAQTPFPDISRAPQNLTLSTTQQPGQAAQEISTSKPRIDWGEAPPIEKFYGREQELGELKRWIVSDRCRIIAVLGIGGIGKTALVARLAEQLRDEFEYVFWRELKNAPPLESISQNCIQFLSNQQRIDLPDDMDDQITLLLQYLRDHRCLIVLDNVETILQAGNRAGQYRQEYEGYGRLIQRLGEVKHQSCLLLTGREKPREVAYLEGEASVVRSLQLSGLGREEGQEILQGKDLFGSEKDWAKLIQLYSGNPLALKLVSEPIREVFGGNIAGFLQEDETVLGDIHDLLDQQFQRLSEPEQEVMYWLAIEREAVSLRDLREDEEMVHSVSKGLLDALASLRRRSMIETTSTTFFTLQPVIME
jgi:hypothetical protein